MRRRSFFQAALKRMRRRFAIVHNARAGKARLHLLNQVVSTLLQGGAEVSVFSAATAAEATAHVKMLAASQAADAIVAAGGDGTVRSVVAALAGTKLPAGVIPLGTGNVIKYELGLPSDAAAIAHLLRAGPLLKVQTGLVNGQIFLLMVGAGFDGRIVATLDETAKRRFGRLAYAGPISRGLIAQPQLFDVLADGTRYQATWVVVTNAAHYGGSFALTCETQLGANKLIAVIFTGASRATLLANSLALGLGRLAKSKTRPRGVIAVPVERVSICGVATVCVEIDGDAAGMTPIEISSNGPAINLIVPDTYVADVTKRHTNRVL